MKTPLLGLLGLLALGALAVMMLRGQLDVTEAAVRGLIVLGAVAVAERVLLPVARLLVGEPVNRHQTGN